MNKVSIVFQKLLAKIFAVSPDVITFISDSKKNYTKRLWILLPLAGWASFFSTINPLFIKWTIDSLTEGWTAFSQIQLNSVWLVFLTIISLLAILSILDSFFSYLQGVLLLRLNKDTESFLEDKFANFLTGFDGAFLSGENNLRLIRNLQWNIGSNQQKLISLAQKVVETIVGLVTLAFVLPLIHPYLLMLIFGSVALDSILDYFQNQIWRKYELLESRQQEQKLQLSWRINSYFNKLLENGWINQILATYRKRRASWIETSVAQGRSDQTFILFKNLSGLVLNIGSLVIAGWLFSTGQIPIGTFVVFQLYISRVKGQLQGLGEIFRWIFELRFELFRYDFLIHIKPKLDFTISNKPRFKNIESLTITNLNFKYPEFYKEEKEYFDQMKTRIIGVTKIDKKLENLPEKSNLPLEQKNQKLNIFSRAFNYLKNKISHQSLSVWRRKNLEKELAELEKMFATAGDNKIVLDNLNFTFNKGNIYAIVGYNGAGKTTLTKLIKRTIDPTSGDIYVNQTSLKTIDPNFWKSYIAAIEQENFLWESLTVRENLLLGLNQIEAKKITNKELYKIIDRVGLKDKIKDLDLIVGENLELSGGQKQLLEIARVIIQKKQILILDEGTNQLDAKKEQLVLDLLQEVKKQAIIIFITHRMTTTRKCDQVLVLESGKITATGTPTKLLAKNESNLFKNFWDTQINS